MKKIITSLCVFAVIIVVLPILITTCSGSKPKKSDTTDTKMSIDEAVLLVSTVCADCGVITAEEFKENTGRDYTSEPLVSATALPWEDWSEREAEFDEGIKGSVEDFCSRSISVFYLTLLTLKEGAQENHLYTSQMEDGSDGAYNFFFNIIDDSVIFNYCTGTNLDNKVNVVGFYSITFTKGENYDNWKFEFSSVENQSYLLCSFEKKSNKFNYFCLVDFNLIEPADSVTVENIKSRADCFVVDKENLKVFAAGIDDLQGENAEEILEFLNEVYAKCTQLDESDFEGEKESSNLLELLSEKFA